ncbi:MAG: bifunctional diaminohydroxyphosphoribosylaminopyrimidine deaminase/5-amino-6-(5-phosphoribosylamino)uracil reductase RibD [Bacteroidaceae bacterium]|nr:bifunctional diaminohydroxyphosphoribosylaminopyrimidine deaminase/5-amino-6-(5-phosphoribosylamino)uracil reductase RibD [Bacteroidaceae bacterium]
MYRCIQLALNGIFTTAPNPMVGAVIVCNDRIIGEGYHHCYGGHHAEVNAINSVRPSDRNLLPQSTLYVSLEPCCHYGKTPPCADLIIQEQIPRVVIGARDTNQKVNGGGIQKLLDEGIEVTIGVLEDECRKINKRFFTFHELHRPYITLKWAQTADGIIGIKGERLIISNTYTQMLCHKLRAEHQSILVGNNTWHQDKPSLTVRYWDGRNPKIIILSHDIDLQKELQGIQSLLIEGGRETLQYFIDKGMWDEAHVEVSSMTINKKQGAELIPAPILKDAVLDTTINLNNYQNIPAPTRQVFLYHQNHS